MLHFIARQFANRFFWQDGGHAVRAVCNTFEFFLLVGQMLDGLHHALAVERVPTRESSERRLDFVVANGTLTIVVVVVVVNSFASTVVCHDWQGVHKVYAHHTTYESAQVCGAI